MLTTVQLLEGPPAVLSLEKICDEQGYIYRMEGKQLPILTKDGHVMHCKSELLYRKSYLESLWTQVPEAMPMQHLETDRRQLPESDKDIGFSHSRKDW